jgi:MinD superfamily P-loop ATPase
MDENAGLLLVDGPPGIGCPVIAASSGADAALLVVEPTVSGVHDLERVLATTTHFQVPAVVAINKADLNRARAAEIVRFCTSREVPVAGEIPYDTTVTEAMLAGQPVTALNGGPASRALHALWESLRTSLLEEG